ncbi:MAG TPA: adenosine deaminase [Gaiellaceae bacterium]|nr:adenosine deaminase [Gaiellaceae bacterium]
MLPYPKIELHVHLEGAVRPDTLFDLARRNGLPLPAETPEELARLYRFRDFAHFIEIWIMTTNVLRQADDFRRITVDYAEEAAGHGAVYVEAIFSPIERTWRGVDWDDLYTGYCDGAQEARELHGVEMRLTPDITRSAPLKDAEVSVGYALKYADRGVVGIGLGGEEALYATEGFERPFAIAREGGLPAVPHAGEAAGPESVRAALDVLGARRIRHGIRAVEDPALVGELAERQVVLDVCPVSNLRTGVVQSLEQHPLPQLVAAGVPCSISTDDPAMFDTDLTRELEVAGSLGVSPQAAYEAALGGVLCDGPTRARLEQVGRAFDWAGVA